MLSLPPPPPPPHLVTRQTKQVSPDQIVVSNYVTTNSIRPPPTDAPNYVATDSIRPPSRDAQNHVITKSIRPPPMDAQNHVITKSIRPPPMDAQNHVITKSIRPPPPALRQPQFQRTNPITWFAAVLCLLFSLVLIFSGVATLIIFVGIKPRNPTFDIPNANLNAVYFDSPEYFNGDFTLIANITNPNRKIDVRFESLDVELFFSDRIISTQSIQPFTQRRRESRLESLHFISSLVFLPKDLGLNLEGQVQGNRINYNIRGTFKVRVTMGFFHLSFWLHSRCQVEMTSPPTGVLVARKCITKR